MDCSEVCRMNVVRLNSVFTSVSTYSTNTTFYKKKYIKDNNIYIGQEILVERRGAINPKIYDFLTKDSYQHLPR